MLRFFCFFYFPIPNIIRLHVREIWEEITQYRFFPFFPQFPLLSRQSFYFFSQRSLFSNFFPILQSPWSKGCDQARAIFFYYFLFYLWSAGRGIFPGCFLSVAERRPYLFRKAKNKPETGVLRIRKGGSPHLRKEQTRDRKLRYPLTMFSPPNNFNPLVVKQEKYWRIPAICRRPASIPGSNFQRKRFRLALKNTAESSIRTRRAATANRRNKNKKWGNLLSRPQKKKPSVDSCFENKSHKTIRRHHW